MELVPTFAPFLFLQLKGAWVLSLFLLPLGTRKKGNLLSTVAYEIFTSLLKISVPFCARMGPGSRCRNCGPQIPRRESVCAAEGSGDGVFHYVILLFL